MHFGSRWLFHLSSQFVLIRRRCRHHWIHQARDGVHSTRLECGFSRRPASRRQRKTGHPTHCPWWNRKWQSSFVLGSITLSPNRIPRQSIKRMNYACRSGHHGIDGACKSRSPLPSKPWSYLSPCRRLRLNKIVCIYDFFLPVKSGEGGWLFCFRMVG